MAYILRTDEILEALQTIQHPRAADYLAQLEALASCMASDLGQALGINAGRATFEGTGFAGTAAPFRPAHPGQPLPDAIESYDTATEWEEDSDLLEAAAGDTCQACGRASLDCSRAPCPTVVAERGEG